jgi:hypothetical protein
VIAEVGVAVTVLPVALLKNVDGDQEYDVAPLADSVTLPGGQKLTVAGVASTLGKGWTVMLVDAVPVHPFAVTVRV